MNRTNIILGLSIITSTIYTMDAPKNSHKNEFTHPNYNFTPGNQNIWDLIHNYQSHFKRQESQEEFLLRTGIRIKKEKITESQ